MIAEVSAFWEDEWFWKGVGFVGQTLFTARVVTQWWASERAKASVVTPGFWWLSVAGTLVLLVYAFHTGDAIFVIGPLLNLFLYVRNLMLLRRGHALGALAVLVPLGVVALVAGAAATYFSAQEKILKFDPSPFWLAVGAAGMALWTLRFPVQWLVSERRGKSVLPASFWWMSLWGAVLLTAYSAYKPDAVFILAYALNPLPCIRNLMLIYRRPRAEAH